MVYRQFVIRAQLYLFCCCSFPISKHGFGTSFSKKTFPSLKSNTLLSLFCPFPSSKQFIPVILPNYLLLSFLDICDLSTRNVLVKRRENIPILLLLVIIHELFVPLLLFLGNQSHLQNFFTQNIPTHPKQILVSSNVKNNKTWQIRQHTIKVSTQGTTFHSGIE